MTSHDFSNLSTHFDCVVMLTLSNWHTEMRSNRYHYAVRFARHLPTIFVQPDLPNPTFYFEDTEYNNIILLHIFKGYGPEQTGLLNKALVGKNYIKPLLWIYNYFFIDFIIKRYAPLKIYHATEDYFCSSFPGVHQLNTLKRVLGNIDMLVAVSEGVKDSYVKNGCYREEHIVIANGCDFKFWAPQSAEIDRLISCHRRNKKVAFYQGNINYRLDYNLIDAILTGMPDWEFWFCGDVDPSCEEWKPLLKKHGNLKYLGKLHPREVRKLAYESTVGIMPFVQNDLIIERSLPLKAFEYVACGLPVVTVPIQSLRSFEGVFEFAERAGGFINNIRTSESSRFDAAAVDKRLEVARRQDYDDRFEVLQSKIQNKIVCRHIKKVRLKILILYDDYSTHVNTTLEHLESFSLFSRHEIFYAIATHNARCEIDLSSFDVIIIHYSVRVSLDWHLSVSYAEALRRYSGFKILFIQDEYDTTEVARLWIEDLGIQVVYTCVPEQYIESVYPLHRFPHVEFVSTLTGYVPISFETPRTLKPLSERGIVIGYRGRPLPYWYGDLGHEKMVIGQEMKKICEERGIIADIAWGQEDRIYGEGWYRFIEDCKAMLGTESGSNVFDEHGEIMKNILGELDKNPSISYEEVRAKYLTEHEGKIVMNQISPKVFEGIAYKTAMVLFEGNYSGIISPNIHYIPLKKDFSNIDEVLNKLSDDSYLEKLVNRAYTDIIESGEHSYRKFTHDFDEFISQHALRGNSVTLFWGLIGSREDIKGDFQPNIEHSREIEFVRSVATRNPLLTADICSISVNTSLLEGRSKPLPGSAPLKEAVAHTLSKYPHVFRVCRAIYRTVRAIYDQLRKLV